MHARLNYACVGSIMSVVASARAAASASGVLSVIVNDCKSRGAPMQGLLAAERACAPHAYV
jgi:uncharacterized protein (DUF2141 family)